jgi:hypothetical protein
LRFFSDNTGSASPEIMGAVQAANSGLAVPYGEDPLTLRLDETLGAFFGTGVRAFALTTGTAANALALATVVPPCGAIFAHQDAHIATDECGAQLALVPGEHRRLDAATFGQALAAYPVSVHNVQPAALSLTQATEFGTVYRAADLTHLAALAHGRAALRYTWTGRASPTRWCFSTAIRRTSPGAPASTCCPSAPPRTAHSAPRRWCDRAHSEGRLRLPQAVEAVACRESAQKEGQIVQEIFKCS